MVQRRNVNLAVWAVFWLRCSLGRSLAALTCTVRRCQAWFVWYILGVHGSVLMVFKSPTEALDYHLLTDHHCPVIHVTCISSSNVRSSMMLGLYTFFWLVLLCSHSDMQQLPSSLFNLYKWKFFRTGGWICKQSFLLSRGWRIDPKILILQIPMFHFEDRSCCQ